MYVCVYHDYSAVMAIISGALPFLGLARPEMAYTVHFSTYLASCGLYMYDAERQALATAGDLVIVLDMKHLAKGE